ncbi:hypothetical protein [Sporolactobacillus putidus]|uniref:DUF148 domain-containing protein n=1 Tax=Sporolactobacillus putidus TaxID=492735 RepID=A0A917S025_9BACL|nr:hypothetical protein [Sporolactobacillus putidus]GGL46039.1 hypothetical protein GCM10007968_07660 [Sporolactobacillus putidus]
MKFLSLFVIPCLAVSIFIPSAANAASCPPAAAAHGQDAHLKTDRQKWLIQVIDDYASPDLNTRLKKDLAVREQLLNEWKKTPAYQKHKAECQKSGFDQENKQKIESIHKQFEEGKISKHQAQKELAALHGKQKGMHGVFRQLKSAVKNKDRTAVQAALEKLDQQLKVSNQCLSHKISDQT